MVLHCVHIPHFLYRSPTDGDLGCFHCLAVVNSAAINISVQVSEQMDLPRVIEQDNKGSSISSFLKNLYCDFKIASLIYILTNSG
jgi:hypothetical protein